MNDSNILGIKDISILRHLAHMEKLKIKDRLEEVRAQQSNKNFNSVLSEYEEMIIVKTKLIIMDI
jgi:hypothetical protein